MNDQELDNAIAELLGWKDICNKNITSECKRYFFSYHHGIKPNTKEFRAIPKYSTDLNAIYEAEQETWKKDYNLRHVYVDNLAKILNPVHGYRMQEAVDLLDAIPRQKAEALLQTLKYAKTKGTT